MLTKPDLADEAIRASLRDNFTLLITEVTFLPLGADARTAVYRVLAADGTPYFLKLRRGAFDEIAVAVPAYLKASGADLVMAPLPTNDGRLWFSAHDYAWVLYPFVEGRNGYEVPLSEAQLVALGATLKAIQTATLPPALAALLPCEDYSPQWRDMVRRFDAGMEVARYEDPIAANLAVFWLAQREEVRLVVDRAEELATRLRARDLPFVVCHTDLHAGNLLIGANDALAIVDWDNPAFAPKERDLMFVGAGLNGNWRNPREAELFYQGYGPAEIDAEALAYYHYERIAADFASFGEQIFGVQGGDEDRAQGLRWFKGNFAPGEAIAIAHGLWRTGAGG